MKEIQLVLILVTGVSLKKILDIFSASEQQIS